MDDQVLKLLVEQRLRIVQIICAALVFSVLVYGAVAWFLLDQGEILPDDALKQLPALPFILAAFGFGALMLAPIVSRMAFRQGGVGHEKSNHEHTLARYQTSVIIGFAARESAAVIGLVATLLTGSLIWVAVLGAAAVLAMIAAWPRKEAVLALFRPGPPPIG